MSEIIQSLWVGDRLSIMEQLSVQSFLTHGHTYHLYTYQPIANLPSGAVVRDANEILPANSIFQYTDYASYAGFSNFFRYKLLLEKGGWWVDTDMVCLRPFDFRDDYLFCSEPTAIGPFPNSAVIKCPPQSPAMAHAWGVCQSRDPRLLKWGETGPRLVAEVVETFSLQKHLQPPNAFCPVGCKEWASLLDPQFSLESCREAFGLHLWNELWRRNQKDKDAVHPPGCPYEILKTRFCIRPALVAG